jgi:aminoacrylate hydrolase
VPLIDGLYCEEHGEGPPLILSAGLGGSGNYWLPNLPALAARHRVILYDHRGTGRSDRALPDAVTVAQMGDDILALIEGLGLDRPHIMGHAAGGLAALALALKAPERVGKLVVVNGWASPDPHFGRCFDARLSLLRDSGPEAYLRAQPLFLYPAPWVSAHHVEFEAELAHQMAGFAGADVYEKRIAALRAFDIADRLGEIAAPTLVLASRDDMLVPYTASGRLAARLPNAQLALMEWGGHGCNVTDAETFDTLVSSFLRS